MRQVKIIDGRALADKICDKLKSAINITFKKIETYPGLAVILVGKDPASHVYVSNKIKRAKDIGIKVFDYLLPTNTSEKYLLDLIYDFNIRKEVNGILLQLPVPKQINNIKCINSISCLKDVDGFTALNVGLLNTGQDCLMPSTPQGVILLIKSVLGEDLSGKKVVILGRSLIVGRPLASMLLHEDCTVTLLHSKSLNIQQECKLADILISAVGRPGLITSEFVKTGACVIDVGITKIADKLQGDVDFESVKEVAGYITPVPGGVGPMTIACMLMNTYKAMCMQHNVKLEISS